MKIAALADIHGNYQALITVLDHLERWKPDRVLVLGDIINRGPRSRDCLLLMQAMAAEHDWQLMRGNHEGYVLNFNRPDHPRQGLEFELRRVIYWTYQSLTKIEREQVEALPEKLSIAPGNGQLIRCLHASTVGDRVGIYPYSSAEELTDLVDLESNLFLIGHTHQPLVKPFQETLVVNVGSVGLPFDGDQRAAYAQLEWTGQGWQAEIVRVPYDLSAAADDFTETGFLSEGGPLSEIILTELKLGWPQLNHWFRRFEIPVLQEEISLEDAVKEYQINPHREEPNRDVPLRFP